MFLGALVFLAGCSGGGGADRTGDSRRGSSSSGVTATTERTPEPIPEDAIVSREGWSILLGVFPKDANGERRARTALERIRRNGRLPDARLEDRGTVWGISVGEFSGPNDSKAKRELDRVRKLRVDGVEPYQSVVLAPPVEAFTGANPDHDLRNAKRIHGTQYVYTLQIGIYGRPDNTTPNAKELAEFRETAERAVADLRAGGDVAFYYHSPRRSMVTVGLFRADDLRPPSGTKPAYQSPQMLALKRKYPLNLLNGAGVRESLPGQRGVDNERLQPSRLVNVPSS